MFIDKSNKNNHYCPTKTGSIFIEYLSWCNLANLFTMKYFRSYATKNE